MTQVEHASLHHGAQHGGSAAWQERLQSVLAYLFGVCPKYGGSAAQQEGLLSVLAYSCLGICQEDVDGVPCCNPFADLLHVSCRALSSARSKGPDAQTPSNVESRSAKLPKPSRVKKQTSNAAAPSNTTCVLKKDVDGVIATCGLMTNWPLVTPHLQALALT